MPTLAAPGDRGPGAARAIRTIEQAIEQLTQFKIRQTLLLTYLAEIQLLHGDLEKSREAAARGLALAGEIGFAWGLGASQRLLGRIAAARGDLAAARRLLEDALATFDAIPARLETARTRAALADLTRRSD